MKQSIYKLLSKVEELSNTQEKVQYLKSIDHPIIRSILRYMFIPELKFTLPPGLPPFKTFEFEEHGRLWAEARKLYIFVEAQSPNLTKVRREQLFINFLEGIYGDDVTLIAAVKDQKSPWKSLNRKLVEKAYPGIFA
jgi:hypothetical protein